MIQGFPGDARNGVKPVESGAIAMRLIDLAETARAAGLIAVAAGCVDLAYLSFDAAMAPRAHDA